MTIFQLFVYSCVAITDLGGSLIQKTCHWDPREHFAVGSLCQVAGAASVGQPIFSDIAELRKVEKFRCSRISITTGSDR